MALATFGMCDAAYLLYTRLAGLSIACGPLFHGCDQVAASSYSTLFGIPLSAYGLLFYISILKIALHMRFSLLERVGLGVVRAYLPHMLLIAVTLGGAFSAYFIYLQGVVIGAWCTYCLLSALTSALLFVTTVMLVRTKDE